MAARHSQRRAAPAARASHAVRLLLAAVVKIGAVFAGAALAAFGATPLPGRLIERGAWRAAPFVWAGFPAEQA